jgi:hypothetical protein
MCFLNRNLYLLAPVSVNDWGKNTTTVAVLIEFALYWASLILLRAEQLQVKLPCTIVVLFVDTLTSAEWTSCSACHELLCSRAFLLIVLRSAQHPQIPRFLQIFRGIWPMPLSLLNHSALALFAQRTRIPTSARSIGFCAIWVCISSSSIPNYQLEAFRSEFSFHRRKEEAVHCNRLRRLLVECSFGPESTDASWNCTCLPSLNFPVEADGCSSVTFPAPAA